MENGYVQQTPVWEKLRHYIDDVAGISRKQFAYNLGISESQVLGQALHGNGEGT